MSARTDLIAYLTPLLRGAFPLESEAQARAGAQALVNRLGYVLDEHDDIETTSLGQLDRSCIRQRYIVVKVPNGSEHIRLPRDPIATEEDR